MCNVGSGSDDWFDSDRSVVFVMVVVNVILVEVVANMEIKLVL